MVAKKKIHIHVSSLTKEQGVRGCFGGSHSVRWAQSLRMFTRPKFARDTTEQCLPARNLPGIQPNSIYFSAPWVPHVFQLLWQWQLRPNNWGKRKKVYMI
jgi:hypothetical protein